MRPAVSLPDQVLNFAEGQGEDSIASVPDVKAPTGDKEDVLGAHSSFKDHRAESEAHREDSQFVWLAIACISLTACVAGH